MADLKRIMIASDLSPRADRALTRAVQLTTEQGAALTVLHVLEALSLTEELVHQTAAEAEKNLRQKIGVLPCQPGEAVTIRTVTGKPFVQIIQRAREETADLVVVGAHGKHFVKDLFLGTTAEKVVRKGDRPVLTVKKLVHGPYRQVLVPVDFSESARRALELALRLAPQAVFHVLHAYEGLFEGQLRLGGASTQDIVRHRQQVAKQARQEMEAFLGSVECSGKPIKRMVRHGRAPHVIDTAARRLRADLVAVGSAGRTGIPYILLGSVAEHVLREATCDVLVVRPPAFRFELP
ncbi:MAG TPA: universal stress protein [Candidatus Tectomicrobia bacterium]